MPIHTHFIKILQDGFDAAEIERSALEEAKSPRLWTDEEVSQAGDARFFDAACIGKAQAYLAGELTLPDGKYELAETHPTIADSECWIVIDITRLFARLGKLEGMEAV